MFSELVNADQCCFVVEDDHIEFEVDRSDAAVGEVGHPQQLAAGPTGGAT